MNYVALDLETTGLDPRTDRVCWVLMCPEDTGVPEMTYVGNGWPRDLVARLTKPESRTTWITHNGTRFDIPFLLAAGIDPFSNGRAEHYDTLVAEQTLAVDGNRRVRGKSLADVVEKRLGVRLAKDVDHAQWNTPFLSDRQKTYAEDDIRYLCRLRRVQLDVAREDGNRLAEAVAFEQEVSPVVARINANGLAFDAVRHAQLLDEAREAGFQATRRLARIGLNPRSSKQCREALAERGYPVDSTSVDVLEPLRNVEPLANDILNARRALRPLGMYGADFVEARVRDGRLYGTFDQLGAATGRFTSYEPNLQQLPRNQHSMIGSADPEYSVVACDYGQLELRLAADIADDMAMKQYLEADDMHLEVAKRVYGVAQPTGEQRTRAKAAVFAFLYGAGPRTVHGAMQRRGARIGMPEVRQLVSELRRIFAGIHRMQRVGFDTCPTIYDEEHERWVPDPQARQPVVVQLPRGHRRELSGNSFRGTTWWNTQVQGAAAVGFKLALLELRNSPALKYVGGLVHDEIVATGVPVDDADEIRAELERCMVAGMQQVCDTVPIVADAKSVGPHWS